MVGRGETYSGLEAGNLLIGKGVRLGNDRDQVDLGVKTSHDLNIQGLQRVASGLNEENASVNAVVDNVHAVDLVLGIQVGIISALDVVHNGAPRLVIVDKVTKSGSVDNSQAETDASLFDIGTDGLDLDGLGNDVQARSLALSGRVQRGVEQRIDESRLAKTRFTLKAVVVRRVALACSKLPFIRLTDDHDVEVEALANTLAVPLVGQVGKTDIASKLPSDNVSCVLDRRRSWLRGNCRRGVRRRNILSRGRGLKLASRRRGGSTRG